MIFRLSQVSQNIPEDELMLFIHSAFILGYFMHCIILLCSSSTCQGTQHRKSGMLAQPQRICSLGGGRQAYWTRKGHFSHRNFQIGPSNLRFFLSQQVSYLIASEAN